MRSRKGMERSVSAVWKAELVEALGGSHWEKSLGDSTCDVEVEEVDGESLWVRIGLTGTSLHGSQIEPFLSEFGGDLWLQGWADGETLTLASPKHGFSLVVGLVGQLLRLDGPSSSPEHPER